MLALFSTLVFVFALAPNAQSQDDANDVPLGDVARSFRKKPASPEVVIDNDNFSKVVEEAESKRAAGTTMTFTLDAGAKNFRVSTPDASCTLSFTAKTTALLSDPIMLDELPKEELAKLDGPASIDGDSFQLSIHNGSAWELREVVIGLTVVRTPDTIDATSHYSPARIVPTAVASRTTDPAQKLQDTTILLRVKGSAAPLATALFRTQLNFALFPEQEWHWAIVRAKGVPPLAPAPMETAQPAAVQPAPGLPPAQTEPSADVVRTSTQTLPSAPPIQQSSAPNR